MSSPIEVMVVNPPKIAFQAAVQEDRGCIEKVERCKPCGMVLGGVLRFSAKTLCLIPKSIVAIVGAVGGLTCGILCCAEAVICCSCGEGKSLRKEIRRGCAGIAVECCNTIFCSAITTCGGAICCGMCIYCDDRCCETERPRNKRNGCYEAIGDCIAPIHSKEVVFNPTLSQKMVKAVRVSTPMKLLRMAAGAKEFGRKLIAVHYRQRSDAVSPDNLPKKTFSPAQSDRLEEIKEEESKESSEA
jgi:hypothetical protein